MNLLVLWVVVLMQAQAAVQAGRIDGIVTRRGTRETVPNARILVTPSEGGSVAARLVRSDRNGRFVVPGLPEGRYRILVERDGYMRAVSVATVDSAGSRAASIELTPTGVIAGRVVDSQGDPVSRAFVRAVASGLMPCRPFAAATSKQHKRWARSGRSRSLAAQAVGRGLFAVTRLAGSS